MLKVFIYLFIYLFDIFDFQFISYSKYTQICEYEIKMPNYLKESERDPQKKYRGFHQDQSDIEKKYS